MPLWNPFHLRRRGEPERTAGGLHTSGDRPHHQHAERRVHVLATARGRPAGRPAPGERPGVRAVYRARPHEAQGPDAGGTRRQAGRGSCTRTELDAGDGNASPATGNTASITAADAATTTSTGVAAGTAAEVQ
jgi:hypothetical protein